MDTVKFAIGDLVFLRVNPSEAGMVTGILFRAHSMTYWITWGSAHETIHYDIELTKEKSFANKED